MKILTIKQRYLTNFIYTLFMFLVLSSSTTAQDSNIEVHTQKQIHLLLHSYIYISKANLKGPDIAKIEDFTPYGDDQFSMGFSTSYVYFTFSLSNVTDRPIYRLFVGTSPVIEQLYLYSDENLSNVEKRGMKFLDKTHRYLSYSIPIILQPHSTQRYYVKVHADANPIEFKLLLEDEDTFLDTQLKTLAFNLLFLGIIFAFMLYSFALSFYVKDKSYLFYALYLFFLLEQQATQLGATQIYFPWWVAQLSLKVNIVNISMLSITAILFAISFLQTQNVPRIHKGYLIFIGVYILEMVLLPGKDVQELTLVVLTSIVHIFYNLWAGIYIYKKGYKQARLFVLGFGIVAVLFLILILDSLGITQWMHLLYNTLLVGTALEAFILLLAFADRYLILQKEKEEKEKEKLLLLQAQAKLIEKEVIRKTHELQNALQTKEILIREVHHRIKNNLHIMLSLIQLQADETDHPVLQQKMTELEHRIGAISETYSMLHLEENIEHIDIKIYLHTLLEKIANSYHFEKRNIQYTTNIEGTLPLQEASYVGLIINEIVTNAYKYAFEEKGGTIYIDFREEKQTERNSIYHLSIQDNGIGFTRKDMDETLGLQLIYTLIESQLKGTITLLTKPHTQYNITFQIKNS